MFNVKFDISGVNNLCEKLKKELKSVKGAKAGILKNKRYPEDARHDRSKPKDGKGEVKKAKGSSITLVENALIQEYGAVIPVTDKMRGWFMSQGFTLKPSTTKIVIPSRPFLRKSLKAQKEWVKYINEMFDANQDGTMTLKEIALNVAELMQREIQDNIDSNMPPANSEMTQVMKGSSSTLMDFGILRSSIGAEVIKK